MSSKPNTAIQRMLPRSGIVGRVHVGPSGKSFSAVAGTTIDASPQDCAYLEANGWFRTGGKDCIGVGATSARPVDPGVLYHGATYVDTTLGYAVIYDNATWRNPATGASV